MAVLVITSLCGEGPPLMTQHRSIAGKALHIYSGGSLQHTDLYKKDSLSSLTGSALKFASCDCPFSDHRSILIFLLSCIISCLVLYHEDIPCNIRHRSAHSFCLRCTVCWHKDTLMLSGYSPVADSNASLSLDLFFFFASTPAFSGLLNLASAGLAARTTAGCLTDIEGPA